MTRSTIKLRPQEPEVPERKVRLRLQGRLAVDLDDYRALYARAHGQEIELSDLIAAILEQFLASDRAFQRRQRTKQPASGASSDRASHGEDSQPLDRGR